MRAVNLRFYNKRLSESRAIEQNQENPMGAGWTAYKVHASIYLEQNYPGLVHTVPYFKLHTSIQVYGSTCSNVPCNAGFRSYVHPRIMMNYTNDLLFVYVHAYFSA
jgi:hypothetical protein